MSETKLLRDSDIQEHPELLSADLPNVATLVNNLHLRMNKIMRVYGMPTMEILELFTGDEFQATKQKAEENIHKINRELVPNPEQFSEFYLSKTQAEFLQDVDEAIAACGITSDETEEINQKYTIGTNQEKESVKEDFWRIQIQVYQTLRKKGYSHWDVIH